MRSLTLPAILGLLLLPACSADASAPLDPFRYGSTEEGLRIALVKQPYHGGRNVAELSRNPDYLEEGGIAPDEFALELLSSYVSEMEGIAFAASKVRPL